MRIVQRMRGLVVLGVALSLIVAACTSGTTATTTTNPETTTTAETTTTLAAEGPTTTVAGTTTTAAQELREFPLAIAAGLDTSPLFAGIDNGFFNAQGIEIAPNIFFSGVELVNSLVSGESLVTVIGTAVQMSGIENGLSLKIIGLEHGIADADIYSTNYMIAGPDSGIEPDNFASLAGKSIGTALGTDGEAGLRAMLAEAGLTIDDVEALQIAPPDMASALQQGSVDAIIFVEPWPTLVESQVEGSYRVNSEMTPIFGPGIIVTTQENIDNERELLIDFLCGAAESHQWARQNKDTGLIEVNSRWTEIPEDVARAALPRISFQFRLSQLVVDGLEQRTIPGLVEIGALEGEIPIDEVIDTSLMKEALEVCPQFFDDLPPLPPGAGL